MMELGDISCALWWFLRCMACFCGSYRVFIGPPPFVCRPTILKARMWTTAEALLSLQPYVSNWYPQINMSAKQQNREPAKQYVSKTTKQCVNTTAKQQNRDFSQSVSTSVSQYFSQSVLTSISQSAFLNKTPANLPFLIGFVPDVGFGNGRFASSDWPANKRERGVIFDPFLGVRNMICFAPGKLCFPLREIDFVTENSLPARGWKTPPKSSFFTGHPMCRDRILTAEEFPTPFVQKWGPWKA